jgi:calcium channel MID1
MVDRGVESVNELYSICCAVEHKSQRTHIFRYQIWYDFLTVHPPMLSTNKISGTAAFSCPLVHSLPYCPSTSYSVPLPAPPTPFTTYDSTILPTNITTPLLSYLTNFTTTLNTIACGRDLYSPIQTCANCQSAYRKWLCSVSFTRCGEASSTSPSADASQSLLPAISPISAAASPRNTNFPAFSSQYEALLPCLETCTAADRACPIFIGFKCPVVRFNADQSYGVGYLDSGVDGQMGGGKTGASSDRWGNVWCNGS